jgi:hypothetical protein
MTAKKVLVAIAWRLRTVSCNPALDCKSGGVDHAYKTKNDQGDVGKPLPKGL